MITSRSKWRPTNRSFMPVNLLIVGPFLLNHYCNPPDLVMCTRTIFRMVSENKTWGAPRIHGELKMLGFDLSERTVQRWIRKAPRSPEPARRWAAFLSNHREAIAAMDFFTVPTLSFGVLYCFFVIAHDRRRILHCNLTNRPTSAWVVQQLREAFPYDSAPKYLIFDRGANFNEEVIDTVKSFGIQPTRTS